MESLYVTFNMFNLIGNLRNQVIDGYVPNKKSKPIREVNGHFYLKIKMIQVQKNEKNDVDMGPNY